MHLGELFPLLLDAGVVVAPGRAVVAVADGDPVPVAHLPDQGVPLAVALLQGAVDGGGLRPGGHRLEITHPLVELPQKNGVFFCL